MKAKFQGTINRVSKPTDQFNISGSSDMVELELSLKGKVQGTIAPPAKEAEIHVKLKLKPLVANELKIGANITILVTDEEEYSKE